MKRNYYSLSGLSEEAKKALPGILDAHGYAGRYEIEEDRDFAVSCLRVNSTRAAIHKMLCLAEQAAHGEEGYVVTVRRMEETTQWIPAGSLREAYKKAIESNKKNPGLPQQVEYAAAWASDDRPSFVDEWAIDYVNG